MKVSSFTVLEILYPLELSELIKYKFKARKVEHNNDRYYMIEVSEEVKKKEIESISRYKSMVYILNIYK